MCSTDINTLEQRLRDFAEACDWDQFYFPKKLSLALSISWRSDLSLNSMWLINNPSISIYSGSSYTVKLYSSEKIGDGEEWNYSKIVLRSDTNKEGYENLVFNYTPAGELSVMGEFVAVS